MTLLRCLTFQLGSLTVTITVLLFLDLFLSSDASICSTMVLSPLGNSDHVVVSVSIDFQSNSKRDSSFHCIAYDYSRAEWYNLCDYLRDVPWEDIFKLSASAAASEFCDWVQDGIDVYIPHCKYPWFSAAYAAAIVHGNHFFCLYQQNKSSESEVKFRQGCKRCQRVPEAAKHGYINKTKEFITSQKLGTRDFWRIAKKVITNLDSSKVSGPNCIPVVVLKNCEPELSYILAELFNKCLK